MSTSIRNINSIIAVIGLLMSGFGLLETMLERFIEQRVRTWFVCLFIVLGVYETTILARDLIYDRTGHGWVIVSRSLFFAQGILAATITVIITAFLLEQCGVRPYTSNAMFRIAAASYALYAGLMILNLFTGHLYHIDDLNVYSRGKWFPVLILPTVVIMLVNLAILRQYGRKLSVLQKRVFLIYALFPLLAMVIQAFLFGVHLIAISSVVAAMFALTYIIDDQTDRYYTLAVENERLKTEIMLAQIQPHFLFNSLAVLRELCHDDPEMAGRALGEFAEYLRYNMESLDSDGMIAFEEELQHTRHYLKLMSYRFPDEIETVYDIRYAGFAIPMLTLQPIVENAVSHGIRGSESGRGRITLTVGRTGDLVRIVVADNGAGFDTGILDETAAPRDRQADGERRTHIGIRNVRARIRDMAGGDLLVESAPGKGTTVTIVLHCVRPQ